MRPSYRQPKLWGMSNAERAEYIETIVIGGGQAGLATGYQLRRHGVPFVILDASERVGDAWRKRWDSLRLFSPAEFDGLAGMRVPAPGGEFISKDQMADYLEAYARHFELPVRSGVKVDQLRHENGRYQLLAGDRRFEADNVIVAMANFQRPRVPTFAAELADDIMQVHSSAYRNPSQLSEGDVLVVGAGNSGAEIAVEVVRSHPTYVSGRSPGAMPFRMNRLTARLLLGGVFHHVLTVDTPFGRRARARGHGTTPLIRVREPEMAAAGVERVGRTVGVRDGLPLLDDGRTLAVRTVIWCTGYAPGFDFIDLPIFGEHGPVQERGMVPGQPGLYFVGLHFQYALSSSMVHGVSRDAARVASAIAARTATRPEAQARGWTQRQSVAMPSSLTNGS
jgi:putative flavoprotein involved in K+ transport